MLLLMMMMMMLLMLLLLLLLLLSGGDDDDDDDDAVSWISSFILDSWKSGGSPAAGGEVLTSNPTIENSRVIGGWGPSIPTTRAVLPSAHSPLLQFTLGHARGEYTVFTTPYIDPIVADTNSDVIRGLEIVLDRA